MKRISMFGWVASLLVASILCLPASSVAQNHPIWTGVGSTLTVDESSAGKYQQGSGAIFRHSGTNVGTIEGRINITNPDDNGLPVQFECLQVCYTDPDANQPGTNRITVYIWRIGNLDGACCATQLVSYFSSNNFPGNASCQTQAVAIPAAYQIFDFANYTYFAYVAVYRSNSQYAPVFYSLRLTSGCGLVAPENPPEYWEDEGMEDPSFEGLLEGTGDASTAVWELEQPGGITNIVPNPTRLEAGIHFAVSHAGPASVAIHDVQGRRVRSLVDELLDAGSHLVSWDGKDTAGSDCPKGVYFVRYQDPDGQVYERKLIFTR